MSPDVDHVRVKERPPTAARTQRRVVRSSRAPQAALLAVAGILACLAVAAAGWFGWRVGDAAVEPAPPAPPSLQDVRVGPARLQVPAAWTSTSPARAGLPGLDPASSVAYAVAPGVPASAVVILGESDHPSLIPAALRSALAAPPGRPAAAVLGGQRAWLYRGLQVRSGTEVLDVNVTVVPSTEGTISLACVSSPGWSGSCRPFDLRRLELTAGRPLAPADDLALRTGLPLVLERLQRGRALGRQQLAAARTRRGQGRAAARLGAAYASAAAHAQPLAPERGPGRAAVDALSAAAAAYRSVARAASTGDERGYAAAAGRARAAEDEAAAALRALSARPQA